MLRIAILGPESSGKTTLAKAIAFELDAYLVEEYSREYFRVNDYSNCSLKDLESIALQQMRNIIENKADSIIISDTEMITMEIWAEDKFGNIPEIILNLCRKQDFDIYILTKPDFPWEYDPLRTDSNRRDLLFEKYYLKLKDLKYRFFIVEGSLHDRIERVKDIIRDFNI